MTKIDISISCIFILIATWMMLQYFKPVAIDQQLKIALNEEHIKAEDLYYNELAVNHPLVIMDTNSPLMQLKKRVNSIVFK